MHGARNGRGLHTFRGLQSSILAAMREFYAQDLPEAASPTTIKDALELLDRAKYLRFPKE